MKIIKNIILRLADKVIRKVIRKKKEVCGYLLCLDSKVVRKGVRTKTEKEGGVIRNPQTYIVCGCGMIFLYACRA